QLLDPLDHHLCEAAAARLADIFDSALLPRRFDVRAAHRVNQGGVTVERKNNIVGYGVPLPVSGEPEHAATKTPVVRSTGHNDAVETSLSHLGPKRAVAPLVFASGETLVDRVAIVRRLDHIVEKPPVVEAISDLKKWITGHQHPPSTDANKSLRFVAQMQCWSIGVLGLKFITPLLHRSSAPISNLRSCRSWLDRLQLSKLPRQF